MIVLYGFLLTFAVLLAVLLSIPVKIRLESTMVFLVQWVFLTVRVVVDGRNIQTEMLLFNRKWDKRKKAGQTAAPQQKKKKKEKPGKKIPFSLIWDTFQEAAVHKVFRMAMLLLRRCLSAIRIHLLHWNVGLKDTYWQGIVCGAVSALPYNDQLQVRGNFEGNNEFLLVIHISIWRILTAVLMFLIFFPYYRAIRIYLRFRAAT